MGDKPEYPGASELIAKHGPDAPIGVCLFFLGADPERAEPVRLRHCQVCRESAAAGLDEEQRRRYCNFHSCGLRDATIFSDEQIWCASALAALWNGQNVDPEALRVFNNHVFATAGVTPAFGVEGTGQRLAVGFYQVTLRGAVHEAMFLWLAMLAGELRINVFEVSAKQARDMIGRERAVRRRARSEWQRLQALRLRTEGVSDYAIAKQLRVTHKTVRDWLGSREEWDRQREYGTS